MVKRNTKAVAATKAITLSAARFIAELEALQSPEELKKIQRYFKPDPAGDRFIGVRMGLVFELAKTFMDMALTEIEQLLEHPVHEVRAGAVSIMDFQARSKKTTAAVKKQLFDLYIRRHDRINNWDLVDRSAPYVVGGYLFDQPRDILYRLALSGDMWERRTAIVSTYYFIRKGQVADTFKIAELLLKDKEDLIHKAAGSWLRTAGGKDRAGLLAFLDRYAAIMPRTMLRYAIEKLSQEEKAQYMAMDKTPKKSERIQKLKKY